MTREIIYGRRPVREALRGAREQALLFRQLATLRTDAPLFRKVDTLRWTGPRPAFAAIAERMDARRLLERAAKASTKA